jgi:hypothetical protein
MTPPAPDLLQDVAVETRLNHRPSRIMVAATAAVGVVLALIAIDIVLINGAQAAPARPAVQVVKMSGAPVVRHVVYLTVSSGTKPGPDGKLHGAFSVTDFTVHAGRPVTLVINNTDTSPHSINSPGAGVNIIVPPRYAHVYATRSPRRTLCVVLHDAV